MSPAKRRLRRATALILSHMGNLSVYQENTEKREASLLAVTGPPKMSGMGSAGLQSVRCERDLLPVGIARSSVSMKLAAMSWYMANS